MRAAIYARMSTEHQNERSPDDQVADCLRSQPRFNSDRATEAHQHE